MIERDLLLEKLKHLEAMRLTAADPDAFRAVDLTSGEIAKLIALLQNDAVPLAECGFYRVTIPCIGQPERSVTGPGLMVHDVPVLQTEHAAECLARCLGRAFHAGQRNRSALLTALLDPRS